MINHIYIPQVLSEDRRERFVKECQPLLLDSEQLSAIANRKFDPRGIKVFAGRQTAPNLHKLPIFKDIFDIIAPKISQSVKEELLLVKSWVNWTDGDKKHELWHIHPSKFSAVYYMTPFNCGTQFKSGLVRAQMNSLIIFPSHLLHTAPISRTKDRYDRYALSMDFIPIK
tara:strand:+ start:1651 stop:2160 length:510 start_codon:yes stop_codon:yes gene_type:complete